MGLLPLGGLLCTWSVSTRGGPRTRRSMRIPPAPWNTTFTGNEVETFWELFTLKINEALHFYTASGRVPNLVWHCSILKKATDEAPSKQSPQSVNLLPQGYGSLHEVLTPLGVDNTQETRRGAYKNTGL